MKEENKCTALVPIEKGEIVEAELVKPESAAERAKRQLMDALKKGLVGDPVSILVAAGIAAAASAATQLIGGLFAAKPQTQTRGNMIGEFVMNEGRGDIYS